MTSQFLPRLRQLLPLDDAELKQVLEYSATLPPDAATQHLTEMLGDSPEAITFIEDFNSREKFTDDKKVPYAPAVPIDSRPQYNGDSKASQANGSSSYAAPPGPPPSAKGQSYDVTKGESKPAPYAAPSGAPPIYSNRQHTNAIIKAATLRAHDEQDMQQHLQTLQFNHHIFNSDIEPEHDTDYYCNCDIHQYKQRKWSRYGLQDIWSQAVMYPGEKAYTDRAAMNGNNGGFMWTSNPYLQGIMSPYGYNQKWTNPWGPSRPIPTYYTSNLMQTIQLNNQLNANAQRDIDAREPRVDIWHDDPLSAALGGLSVSEKEKPKPAEPEKKSKMTSFRQSLGIKNSEERAVSRTTKAVNAGLNLRDQIIEEENGRWPDENWRIIVMAYQQHVGMAGHIRELRARRPIQYLHLLRAGYFEPIPVAWANQASNPLKFSIEAPSGWRGITPTWRGYEDTAEERLYWVLNHREGSVGQRLKPDFISEMRMANERMAKAVEPPPAYFSNDDTCHVQHTSAGYSKQVMPSPFRPYDAPESATDDTMILLDISGSMGFKPQRPVYQEYLVTGYTYSTQPMNKDVAKAVVRRFTDAMAHHDHLRAGYDLVTFSSSAQYMGAVHHQNLEEIWGNIRFGGGTRVMTGWQQVKERHFQKHSESATYHPVYGWQAGPETPILRLLLLLDGEATDMDEFELDLLNASWAHVTVFLIGVDGCPHHHRHANELQRISDVNHHVSFVDAQGNFPERYVTHELLKRHLGYDVTMQEFQAMEELPPYSQF